MKINRATLNYGVGQSFEEDIDFSKIELDPTHIRRIDFCHAKVVATDYETILRIAIHIDAVVIGVCSYSLEEVELKLKIDDEINFSDDENDEDCYYQKSPIIDMDEYLLGILLANVPVRIIKKGAKLPKDGQGYRVLNQDDYEKEKANATDPRWDKLDSVKISDD